MPRLSDQERQEVMRYLEADQPLPEKYRFLLFEDKRQVELVWNGKTNTVCNVVLPFQTIEQVDEPRAEQPVDAMEELQTDLFSTDPRGRQLKGWTNKLIWGDNKLILSSLKNGPLREQIEAQGGLKLIYIDPPFDVGADFSMDIEIGGESFTKKPNILEEIAYRDTWGQGADSFVSMIYERLGLIRDLLSPEGTLYIHMGWQVSHHIRAILDEIFGTENCLNSIIWKRQTAHSDSGQGSRHLGRLHDVILLYSKSNNPSWNMQYTPYEDSYLKSHYSRVEVDTGRRYRLDNLTAPGGSGKGNPSYELFGITRFWRYSQAKMQTLVEEGRIVQTKPGSVPQYKRYLDEMPGVPIQDLWLDVNSVNSQAVEAFGYSTQKPETLLERIIRLSSNEGDLVADFFCGSGTTAAVAEKLGRKWIATDLGKFAIHTTRKRLIGVQRQLKAEGKNYRAFEILNLGRYERSHYIGINPNLREEQQQQQLRQKEADFLALILKAYQAEPVSGFACFQGKRAGRLVAIGPVNLPISRLFVEELILECRKQRLSRVDLLGFEFEMGLFPNVLDDARAKGIDIAPKYIPADVFDKRAVDKHQVVFHDVAYIEATPLIHGNNVAIQLSDFTVFYSQDSIAFAEASLAARKKAGSRIIVDNGQIVKLSKNARGQISQETLTQHWTDWIDYWAVDFNYESKREIIRLPLEPSAQDMIPGLESGQLPLATYEERWTGDYIFENEWQSFRTRRDRSLELTTIPHELTPGRRKIAVKVVDIFGNDTMTILDVAI
ncbi:MAG: site-specific DNA-methyltransferase [Cyanobacteriota bacterium]